VGDSHGRRDGVHDARTLTRVPEPMRIRREPPPLRRVTVVRRQAVTPRLVRVTLGGPELEGLDPGLPAASVRLLLPSGGALTMPTWNGNEFLLPDGSRPPLRTLTPRRWDGERQEIDVEVVLHGDGPLSRWAGTVEAGAVAALSGTGRGYTIDGAATRFVLAGDESALPAISVLLEALPRGATVTVLAEITHPDARFELPAHPGATVTWHDLAPGAPPGDALVGAVQAADISPAARVWAAGEAAAVQRIRTHLFDERGLPRSQCTVRGYWKHGRAGTDDEP
jgi:NADPH-dependent ferric siderophore reductase